MKILIVDDEKPARDRLNRMIESLPNCEAVAQASNGIEALAMALSTEPDIVLMDIRMPGMDGIQAARHLSEMTQPPAVIFTTAYADHALEAFETHAVDYLLKPVKKDRLQAAIEAATKPNKAQVLQASPLQTKPQLSGIEPRQHICARVRGSLVLVPINDIYYFNADHKYVTVCHTGGEVLIEDPLKALETEFGNLFYRIHRNALISLSRVSGLKAENDGHYVSFQGIDNTLEVSRRHLSGVRKTIKNI
ncbi:MAG: two-component system response regulator AlgR [Gammaproteobacteria bacterium]|jgi:two-component system response regulator AlgR